MHKKLLFTCAVALASIFMGCSDDSSSSSKRGDIEFSIISPDSLVTSEDGTSLDFSVALAKNPNIEVTITLTSDNPKEGTVSPTSLTFNSSNWDQPQAVTVTGVDDNIVDGDINYNIIVGYYEAADGDGEGTTSSQITIAETKVKFTNADNDKAELVVSADSNLKTSESGSTASFDVKLAAQPLADVKVNLKSDNESEGVPESSALIFNADNWNVPQTVVIKGVDDDLADGDVAYNIALTIESEDKAWNGADSKSVALTNIDNDKAGLVVAEGEYVTDESGKTALIEVALSSKPIADVVISITSNNTDEGSVDVDSITFSPDNWNVPQTITINGVADHKIDGDQNYTVSISSSSDDANYNNLTIELNAVNQDTDEAKIVVSPDSGIMTNESGSSATFDVTLSVIPQSDVTIALSGVVSIEGTIDKEQLVFTPDNWNVPQTVTVTGVDDKIIDGNQSYDIELTADSDDESFKNVVSLITVTNVDNDIAGVTLLPVSEIDVTEGSEPSPLAIALNTKPKSDVVISWTNPNPDELSFDQTSIIITPDEWDSEHTVYISAINDNYAYGDKTIKLEMVVKSEDSDYAALSSDDKNQVAINVNKIDDDKAGIDVKHDEGLKTGENGDAATLSLSLTSCPFADVTITITSDNDKEGQPKDKQIVFTADNWAEAKDVVISGVDDDVADGDIKYNVSFAVESTDTSYDGLKLDSVALTNVDDEIVKVIVTPTDLYFTPGSKSASFSVKLASKPLADVSFELATATEALGSVDYNKLTFTSDNWDTAQIVTVAASEIPKTSKDEVIITSKTVSSSSVYHDIDVTDVNVHLIYFDTQTFEYTGTAETLTLYPATYKLEVWGAQGGQGKAIDDVRVGSAGGYAVGELTLTEPTNVFVYIGGQGATGDASIEVIGGFNGGGSCPVSSNDTKKMIRGGGGGASDIRLLDDTLQNRVIVAGGGGGGDSHERTTCFHEDNKDLLYSSGVGGGLSGVKGSTLVCDSAVNYRHGGEGGTQTAGGAYGTYKMGTQTAGTFGQGGTGGTGSNNYYVGGGGGGGWYGGGGGAEGGGEGGGGSSFLFDSNSAAAVASVLTNTGTAYALDDKYQLKNASTIDGAHEMPAPDGSKETGHQGNGYARITLVK